MRDNDGHQFGRLPATERDREVEGRPTREAVVDFWQERYGIPAATWGDYSFWERGSGKIWAFHGEVPSPARIQGLGMSVLRTDHEHWKPTTNAAQRFGGLGVSRRHARHRRRAGTDRDRTVSVRRTALADTEGSPARPVVRILIRVAHDVRVWTGSSSQ